MGDEYNNLISEFKLGKPNLNEWKLYSTWKDFKVYSKINENTGFIELKGFGTYPFSTERFITTFLDLEYRKSWAELKIIYQ